MVFRNRIARAIDAIRDAIATVSDWHAEQILDDDDLVDDLLLEAFELESLGLVLEEIFGISAVPPELWRSPIYRSLEELAEWCIRHSEAAAWAETLAMRRRA